MTITQKPANPNNYSQGRFGYALDLLVIHTMQGYLGGTDSWFANPGSKVSSHYGVGLNGEVHQYVQDGDTSWANGNWPYNCRSITLEFEDNNNPEGIARTDAQYAVGAQLIADKCRQYSIPCDRAHIIGHREVPGNVHPLCPGNEDIDRLIRQAAALLNAIATPVVAPVPKPHGTVKVTAVPFLNLRKSPSDLAPLATGLDGSGHPITHLPTGAVVNYVDVVPADPGSRYQGPFLVSIRGHYFAAEYTTYGRGIARLLAALVPKKK